MKLYRIQRRQRLALSIDAAWKFFSNPWNLQKITPPWLDFYITNDVSERIYPGLIIMYRLKTLYGMPTIWITEITHVAEPHFFVDEMRFGPYRFWHHQHHFTAVSDGVEIQDIVHYAMKFGIFGQLLNHMIVHSKLEEIFNFRKNTLEHLFNDS